jgi:hypothetical protein
MEFYKVRHNERGYYEVVNGNGTPILSADTASEAWREIELMEREWELD